MSAIYRLTVEIIAVFPSAIRDASAAADVRTAVAVVRRGLSKKCLVSRMPLERT